MPRELRTRWYTYVQKRRLASADAHFFYNFHSERFQKDRHRGFFLFPEFKERIFYPFSVKPGWVRKQKRNISYFEPVVLEKYVVI